MLFASSTSSFVKSLVSIVAVSPFANLPFIIVALKGLDTIGPGASTLYVTFIFQYVASFVTDTFFIVGEPETSAGLG